MARAAMKEKCGGCKFFDLLHKQDQVAGQPLKGFCHRFPPRASWTFETKVTTEPLPVMYAENWCGEFQPKR